MSRNAFCQLAPFVQEFIYRARWQQLHPFQDEAIAAILSEPGHTLICSATASGKTEAAMLPIITRLHADPPQSIGALYIGPLKALINDQFLRLNDLLEDSGIPAQSWHGDVAQSKKQRFLRQARGILQITPESMEAMLMRRHHELTRLFGDLRFVVIDEVHAFMDSDRGRQVICQLERLGSVCRVAPQRIGLSATIGEPQLAMDWLRGNTHLPARRIDSSARPAIELAMDFFLLPPPPPPNDDDADMSQAPLPAITDDESMPLRVDRDEYFAHMHRLTQMAKKTLIFANSRESVEDIGLQMRNISARESLPDFYHVHHGSVSAPLRESAETAMRERDKPACVAATVTLELGIDLGQLDQVLQVNATHTVSSFVQRLGRSGRRAGASSRMFFYCADEDRLPAHIGEEQPWNLLQTIAIIQLYAEDRWIEPPRIPRLPTSLLYHQTMSIVYAHTELTPPQLAERVLSLSVFKGVTQDHFRALLRHLIEIDHLEMTPQGRLIIGVTAEKIVNHYSFFAVFADAEEFRVRDKTREIGRITSPPQVDDTLLLAGYIWRVLQVDYRHRIVEVKRAAGVSGQRWHGGGAAIHTRVLRRMKRLLGEDLVPQYLRGRARLRLDMARQAADRAGLLSADVHALSDGKTLLLPWLGTRQFETLTLALRHGGLAVSDPRTPYYAIVEGDVNVVRKRLHELRDNPPAAMELAGMLPNAELCREKYDRFAPDELLREAYATDWLDVDGAIRDDSPAADHS